MRRYMYRVDDNPNLRQEIGGDSPDVTENDFVEILSTNVSPEMFAQEISQIIISDDQGNRFSGSLNLHFPGTTVTKENNRGVVKQQGRLFSGSQIPLDKGIIVYQTDTAKVFTNYIVGANLLLGSSAKIWINTTTEPTISVDDGAGGSVAATQTGGVAWETDTNFDLCLGVEGGENDNLRVIYFFVKRDAP